MEFYNKGWYPPTVQIIHFNKQNKTLKTVLNGLKHEQINQIPPIMTPPFHQTYQIVFYLQNVANHAQFCYFSKCLESRALYLKITGEKFIIFHKRGTGGPLHGKFSMLQL